MGLLSIFHDWKLEISLWSSVFFASYKFLVYSQRLFFHPLSKVPGPKLAAASTLFEFYWDSVNHGRLWAQLPRLHAKYGPIIRIGPNEIHISDSNFFDTVFGFNSDFRKEAMTAKEFGLKHALFATEDHKVWSRKRAALGNAFTRSRTLELKEMIDGRLDHMCDYIRDTMQRDGTVDLAFVFRATPAEIITRFMFADEQDFYEDAALTNGLYDRSFDTVFGLSHLGRWLPWWLPMFTALIRWQLKLLIGFREPGAAWMQLFNFASSRIKEVVKNHESGTLSNSPHPLFFDDFLASPSISKEERSQSIMAEFAVTIWTGGFDTVGFALTVGAYSLLRHKACMRRLQQELRDAWPNPEVTPDINFIDKLPYFKAVMRETFRLTPGALCRLTRVNTERAVTFGDYTLPSGTLISMSLPMILQDASIWGDDHEEFRPERWLIDDKEKLAEMNRYLVTFSKGNRVCPATELAWVECQLIMATVFRKFDLEISEGTGSTKIHDDDIFPYYETFTPGSRNNKQCLPVKSGELK